MASNTRSRETFVVAMIMVLGLAVTTALQAWGEPRAVAGVDGDLVLGSFISSGGCSPGTTNCASDSTGFTYPGTGTALNVRAVNGDGLHGISQAGGDGVKGFGDTGNGVMGTGAQDGVKGVGGPTGVGGSGTTYGVYGSSADTGVYGTGGSYGVSGQSATGTGVYASGGYAGLEVTGKAIFSTSGRVHVVGGATRKVVSLSGVTPKSMVLATPQQAKGPAVEAAIPRTNSFTIVLTKPAPAGGVEVAYFVLG
jgi:hypothetical protein